MKMTSLRNGPYHWSRRGRGGFSHFCSQIAFSILAVGAALGCQSRQEASSLRPDSAASTPGTKDGNLPARPDTAGVDPDEYKMGLFVKEAYLFHSPSQKVALGDFPEKQCAFYEDYGLATLSASFSDVPLRVGAHVIDTVIESKTIPKAGDVFTMANKSLWVQFSRITVLTPEDDNRTSPASPTPNICESQIKVIRLMAEQAKPPLAAGQGSFVEQTWQIGGELTCHPLWIEDSAQKSQAITLRANFGCPGIFRHYGQPPVAAFHDTETGLTWTFLANLSYASLGNACANHDAKSRLPTAEEAFAARTALLSSAIGASLHYNPSIGPSLWIDGKDSKRRSLSLEADSAADTWLFDDDANVQAAVCVRAN